jgi:hypothetical protein
MKLRILVFVVLVCSKFAVANECELDFTKADLEKKAALKLEIQSIKLLKEIFELAKLETNKSEVCKKGELNKQINIQSSEHYKEASKHYLAASKSCQGKFANMAKESADLSNQQISIRADNIKKMEQFLTSQCK